MNKKIIFITQAKGGSGKSVLAFMLAEKYTDAEILDLDDATTTSMKQLAYRKPQKVSFLDSETKRIDRGAFNILFESVVRANIELFIADLGASVAEQLPKYFSVNGVEFVIEILKANNIRLQLICVIGGGNIFRATMEYLAELVYSVKGNLEILVAVNGFFPLTPEQQTALSQFVSAHQLTVTRFDLIHDKGENAMRAAETVMNEGKGLIDFKMDARKKKEMLRKFGQKLSEARQKRGLSLRELAALCDVDASDIHRFEHGQKNPTIATVADLAMGLGVELRELLDFII